MPESFSFPFIGAGRARYFEWAELQVWFSTVPTPRQRQRIVETLPAPLPDARWRKQHLIASSNPYVNCDIGAVYSGYSGERLQSYVPEREATRAFDDAIDRWLKEAHEIVPIHVAYRRQDTEAGGTDLSDWHTWSVRQARRFLPAFADALAESRKSPAKTLGLSLVLDVFTSNPAAELTEAEHALVAPVLREQRLDRARTVSEHFTTGTRPGDYAAALRVWKEQPFDAETAVEILKDVDRQVVSWAQVVDGDVAHLVVELCTPLRQAPEALPTHLPLPYLLYQCAAMCGDAALQTDAEERIRAHRPDLGDVRRKRLDAMGRSDLIETFEKLLR